MGREERKPAEGESYVAFHARLLEEAEQMLGRRPEQPARTRIDALTFDAAAFGTVPGAGEAATRTAGWTQEIQAQYARVGVEVADLQRAARSAKEDALRAEQETVAAANRGAPR